MIETLSRIRIFTRWKEVARENTCRRVGGKKTKQKMD